MQKETSTLTRRSLSRIARISSATVRLHLVDPAAYTPPYDRALAAALAARPELDVTLVTSAFRHGEVPPAPGVRVQERFYGRAAGRARGLRHVPDMLAYRRAAAREADLVHFQWLSVQELDAHLLPRRPRVLTAHDVLPREPRRGQRAAQRRLYERMGAVVVHSEHGRARLVGEVGLDPALVEVIPHGVLDALRSVAPRRPPELPDAAPDGPPVVLLFGLLRPYKGLDVLLEAWRGMTGAELWVVGAPRMALPDTLPSGVRMVARFVTEAEAAWCFARAAVAVLPYREIDQSGVLSTALGFGLPLVLSDVGGFPEVEPAVHVPPGDPDALRAALQGLVDDPGRRAALAAAAREAAATTYAWGPIAERHAALYARMLR
jgi:glycosyltransferase involved in cell wall biosynthesis